MIPEIDNEQVMQACLLVNDDLQKTFSRVRCLKQGQKPQKFVPGESTSNSALSPSHIYTQQKPSQEQPKPAAQAEPVRDLLDFGAPSQPKPQP
jgi:hypothetical protein